VAAIVNNASITKLRMCGIVDQGKIDIVKDGIDTTVGAEILY